MIRQGAGLSTAAPAAPTKHGRAPRWITRIRSRVVSRFVILVCILLPATWPWLPRTQWASPPANKCELMKVFDADARQGSPWLHLLPDGPDKSGELARERDDDLGFEHAPGAQTAVLCAQAQLRLPGDIADWLG